MMRLPTMMSHIGVIWSATALRYNPIDVLTWFLDVAGLTVHAILRVYLESITAIFLLDHFINPGRAVALRRLVELR